MFLGVGRGTFDAAPGNLRLQKTLCAVILTVPPKDTRDRREFENRCPCAMPAQWASGKGGKIERFLLKQIESG